MGKAQIADCPPISTGVLARPKPAEDREGPRLSGNPTARSENSPQRFYSISAQIRQERAAYYDILEQTRRGTLDITPWMEWFLGCLGGAIDGAQAALASVLAKGRFWVRLQGVQLNDRQRLVINRSWAVSRSSSLHPSTQSWLNVHRTLRCATSHRLCNAAFLSAARKAGAAPALR